jgi:hypothetical protein
MLLRMEISKLFGLPAHPLIVHGVVVLVPLAAVLLVVAVAWPGARSHLVWVTVAVAAAAMILTPLATGSGEELEHQVRETETIERHAELGEAMIPFSIALFVGAAGVAGLEEVRRRSPDGGGPAWSRSRLVAAAVAGLAIVAAVGSTVQVAVVGHTGAQATWQSVGERERG